MNRGLKIFAVLAITCLILSCSETTTAPTKNFALLRWTAPSDVDNAGNIKRAVSYEMRYSIIDSQQVLGNFSSCIAVTGLPVPSIPGAYDSVLVQNLPTDTLIYFGIISKDAAGNASLVSNIAVKRTPDETESNRITTLQVVR